MPRFDGLIFDLGGTLIYFNGDWPKVFAQASTQLIQSLKAEGVNIEEESFLGEFQARMSDYHSERESEFIEYTTAYILRNMLAELGYPAIQESLIQKALKTMYAVSQAHWHPEEDTLPTLEVLRKAGYRLGMISNASDDADVQALIDKAGVRPYFEVILTSAAVGIRKPNPRIFHMAIKRLGTSLGKAAMVGDTLGADILGANNAGMFSIWITRRADVPDNRAHLDTIRPDAVIDTLSDLPRLLESL
jgi:2-haloalkanoic acid dehalogenase type II